MTSEIFEVSQKIGPCKGGVGLREVLGEGEESIAVVVSNREQQWPSLGSTPRAMDIIILFMDLRAVEPHFSSVLLRLGSASEGQQLQQQHAL